MNDGRYQDLMRDAHATLLPEEKAEGWHFCTEWDGLLVGPGMEELCACSCFPEDHPVYKTKPPEPPPMHITEV